MITLWNRSVAIGLSLTAAMSMEAYAEKIRVGVVQTVIENNLNDNRIKLLQFIDDAKRRGCRLVIFPEGALYWPDIAIDKPTKSDLDAAIEQIGRRTRSAGIHVIFGVGYKLRDAGEYHNRGVVFDASGKRQIFYCKNRDVPQRFYVCGVPCNLAICSDRGYLEHSDLPCLVQGSQVIIDISGGHGGDDGRPDLRWIRYRPWARRTGAYVIVANPLHEDTDFMGHSPWGGGSAIVRPDGSIQASRTYEEDVMIVEDIDTDRATRSQAMRRRSHPVFRSFWDMGKNLLEGGKVDTTPDVSPYSSARRPITIAAAQIACSKDIYSNTKKIVKYIRLAADRQADIVAFPELAVTGGRDDDILAADRSALDEALDRIRNEARTREIYVIAGMPYVVSGALRNCAFVIGDDGDVKTRYAQIAPRRNGLFRGGESARDMWFMLKGVHSIVTIGDDADWIEIGDLAANRGMCLHFHLRYAAHPTTDSAILRKQTDLLMLSYATYGAVVNAADPSSLTRPSSPGGGRSLIVSREGGHNKPAPDGVEYYLPYQTSVVKSAGLGETLIVATRNTSRVNDLDLNRNWRNRNRRARGQRGWHEWMNAGTRLIAGEPPR